MSALAIAHVHFFYGSPYCLCGRPTFHGAA